jgi:tRNA-2-methylthio-N6-dimethylallyladenosine synthase
MSFPDLLEAVQQVPGLERIRFTTSHPKDLSPRLIHAFGRLSKLCEHIHLPLQSGSNRILEGMKRGYTREEYWEKVLDLRRTCPEISITTDMIVGFPGEGERDFQESLEIMEKVQFDDLFSFRYSDRPRTRASSLEGKVPEEVKQKRLLILQSLQRKISDGKNRAWEGRVAEVLAEGPSKAGAEEKTGRTRTNRIVNFPGVSVSPGSLVRVKIKKALAHSLRGEIQKE